MRGLHLSATWGHAEQHSGFKPWQPSPVLSTLYKLFCRNVSVLMICKIWLYYSFFIRQTSTELTPNQYEVISEETLQSLSDKFDVIAESIDCDPEYDVSYGVSFVKC